MTPSPPAPAGLPAEPDVCCTVREDVRRREGSLPSALRLAGACDMVAAYAAPWVRPEFGQYLGWPRGSHWHAGWPVTSARELPRPGYGHDHHERVLAFKTAFASSVNRWHPN